MRVLLILAVLFTMQPSTTINVSDTQIGLGETITYTITTSGLWVNVTLSEGMTITATAPDCIMQPSYGAYCVLDTTDTLTITARLDRLLCSPLRIDAIVEDVTHVRGPDVAIVPQACIYLPIIRQ